MVRQFNDTAATDLKQWSCQDGIWLLHLIDHATRYRAYRVIRSERIEVVIEGVFKIWMLFGTAGKFLVDNGGEFDNNDYRSMCENLNIRIFTTAIESPWSNGLFKRHNAVLGMLC